MGNKQFLAQVGVLILIGLNVAGYSYFWPSRDERATPVTKVATTAGKDGTPETPPRTSQEQAAPVKRLVPPPAAEAASPAPLTKEEQERAIKQMLVNAIQSSGAPPPLVEIPMLEETRKTLPPIDSATLPAGVLLPDPQWQIKQESVGTRRQIIASIRPRPSEGSAITFHILCDRVDTSVAGTLQASGKITFRSAGVKGSCERLNLTLNEARIVFEEHVEISCDTRAPVAREVLRADKITWEAQSSTDRASGDVRPATFGVPAPGPLPSLGEPR